MEMILLQYFQGFTDTHSVSTWVPFIKETKSFGATKSFIIYCKYLGRLKVWSVLFLGHFFRPKLKSSKTFCN